MVRRHWLSLSLISLPVVILLERIHTAPQYIFVAACLAILPLAGWMGRATEHLAHRMGAGIGALLNATCGNTAELILAAMALHKGMEGVVKASIIGTIIGNVLLVLGLSILCGGLKYPRQIFNSTTASLGTTLLALSAAGLLIPTLFHDIVEWKQLEGGITVLQEQVLERGLGLKVSVVLFAVYLLHLLFSLKTHKNLFLGTPPNEEEAAAAWSVKKAVGVLVAATAAIAWVSEILVSVVAATSRAWGLTDVFVGVIVVAVIGNAAEHSSALLMAMKNKMDLSVSIAIGSSLQIALFVAPLLVFMSYAFGNPMDLRFTALGGAFRRDRRGDHALGGARRRIALDGGRPFTGPVYDHRDRLLLFARNLMVP